VVRALAAEAALLDAAERGRRVGNDAAVEADHAGFEPLGNLQTLPQVIGDETVLGVVRGLYGLVDRLEGGDRRNRAEDFVIEEL
jgi:hypothetical protein